MPRYSYRCSTCELLHETIHSIKTTLEECPSCNSLEFKRIPTSFMISSGQQEDNKKVGDVVKESIEEFRSDLKEEKEKLTKQTYKT